MIYLNYLNIDILQIIESYLYDVNDTVNFFLNLDDYNSRSFLMSRYSELYEGYRRLRKDVGIRLNKLLAIQSYFDIHYQSFERGKKEFKENFVKYYFHGSQQEFSDFETPQAFQINLKSSIFRLNDMYQQSGTLYSLELTYENEALMLI